MSGRICLHITIGPSQKLLDLLQQGYRIIGFRRADEPPPGSLKH